MPVASKGQRSLAEISKPAANSVMGKLLASAAGLKPSKHVITLVDGNEIEFYLSPMTAGQRRRAREAAGTDDASAVALQLLIAKAQDANGNRLFTQGMAHDLEEAILEDDLVALQLEIFRPVEAPGASMKSTSAGDEETA